MNPANQPVRTGRNRLEFENLNTDEMARKERIKLDYQEALRKQIEERKKEKDMAKQKEKDEEKKQEEKLKKEWQEMNAAPPQNPGKKRDPNRPYEPPQFNPNDGANQIQKNKNNVEGNQPTQNNLNPQKLNQFVGSLDTIPQHNQDIKQAENLKPDQNKHQHFMRANSLTPTQNDNNFSFNPQINYNSRPISNQFPNEYQNNIMGRNNDFRAPYQSNLNDNKQYAPELKNNFQSNHPQYGQQAIVEKNNYISNEARNNLNDKKYAYDQNGMHMNYYSSPQQQIDIEENNLRNNIYDKKEMNQYQNYDAHNARQNNDYQNYQLPQKIFNQHLNEFPQINTQLSKDYIMREKNNPDYQPAVKVKPLNFNTNELNSIKKDMKVIQKNFADQLSEVRNQALKAVEEKNKAEAELEALKEKLKTQQIDKEKYKKNLERALTKNHPSIPQKGKTKTEEIVQPEKNQPLKNVPLKMYGKGAKSIEDSTLVQKKLEGNSQFVPLAIFEDKTKDITLSRIANMDFTNATYQQHKKQPKTDEILLDSTTKEFEEILNIKPKRPSSHMNLRPSNDQPSANKEIKTQPRANWNKSGKQNSQRIENNLVKIVENVPANTDDHEIEFTTNKAKSSAKKNVEDITSSQRASKNDLKNISNSRKFEPNQTPSNSNCFLQESENSFVRLEESSDKKNYAPFQHNLKLLSNGFEQSGDFNNEYDQMYEKDHEEDIEELIEEYSDYK